MKKRFIFGLIITVILVGSMFLVNAKDLNKEFRKNLRRALLDELKTPENKKLELNVTKDLIEFYLAGHDLNSDINWDEIPGGQNSNQNMASLVSRLFIVYNATPDQDIITCTDSDGGKDYYVKGTTAGIDFSYNRYMERTDFCVEYEPFIGYVREHVCQDGKLHTLQYNCSNGCQDGVCVEDCVPNCVGKECGDDGCGGSCGDCLSGESCENGTCTGVKEYCMAVTSGHELNLGVLVGEGLITLSNCNNLVNSMKDEMDTYVCLNEHGIENVTIKWSTEVITQYVLDCRENVSKCTDSDGGKNYSVQGTVSGVLSGGLEFSYTDDCNGNIIVEWYCQWINPKSESVYACKNGCENGTCIDETPTCTDTDSGMDYYIMGTAQGIYGSCTDSCITQPSGEVWIHECYCDDPNPWSASISISCPDGSVCEDGACIKLRTCSEQQGDICLETEYCPGSGLDALDTDRCCDQPCETASWSACSECGKGLFNFCDEDECNAISEGCYFEGLFTCTSCSEIGCSNYDSENDCNWNRCNKNCTWNMSNCVDTLV